MTATMASNVFSETFSPAYPSHTIYDHDSQAMQPSHGYASTASYIPSAGYPAVPQIPLQSYNPYTVANDSSNNGTLLLPRTSPSLLSSSNGCLPSTSVSPYSGESTSPPGGTGSAGDPTSPDLNQSFYDPHQ